MGLLPDMQNCRLPMHQECRERFPRHRLQRNPLVSDPGMPHDTCVMHVPWCMSGLLTRGGGENVPGIPGACATRNFAYLVRGPLTTISNGAMSRSASIVLSHFPNKQKTFLSLVIFMKRMFMCHSGKKHYFYPNLLGLFVGLIYVISYTLLNVRLFLGLFLKSILRFNLNMQVSSSWIIIALPASNIAHYNDIIITAMASQITSLTIVYSNVYSGTDQRKHQSSASLAFVRGIHQWPTNPP